MPGVLNTNVFQVAEKGPHQISMSPTSPEWLPMTFVCFVTLRASGLVSEICRRLENGHLSLLPSGSFFKILFPKLCPVIIRDRDLKSFLHCDRIIIGFEPSLLICTLRILHMRSEMRKTILDESMSGDGVFILCDMVSSKSWEENRESEMLDPLIMSN